MAHPGKRQKHKVQSNGSQVRPTSSQVSDIDEIEAHFRTAPPCSENEADDVLGEAVNEGANILAYKIVRNQLSTLTPFMFTCGLMVGVHKLGYAYRYCYPTGLAAAFALDQWDGHGHPPGPWIKAKGFTFELSNPVFFTDQWDEFSKNWEEKARKSLELRNSSLKFLANSPRIDSPSPA